MALALSFVCAGSLLGIAILFIGYPLLVYVRSREQQAPSAPQQPQALPRVSIVLAVRNGEGLIEGKLRNCLQLDYPDNLLEILVFSDGSTDGTAELLRRSAGNVIRVLISDEHVGKIAALNQMLPLCRGEIVLFTDADAQLAPEALRRLVERFADPQIGGVCGVHVIGQDQGAMREGQAGYIAASSWLHRMESRVGSVTANDGKIYAIRKRLFLPIPPGVTDDLFVCLSVVRQGARFVCEPAARAVIRVPSRNWRHELVRRRRIVSTSLRGLFWHRALFDPRRYGLFSCGLLINKVLRRLLPLLLLMFYLSGGALVLLHPALAPWLAPALLPPAMALLYPLLSRGRGVVARAAATAAYFFLGNLGTLLGVLDYLTGRRIDRWEPLKQG